MENITFETIAANQVVSILLTYRLTFVSACGLSDFVSSYGVLSLVLYVHCTHHYRVQVVHYTHARYNYIHQYMHSTSVYMAAQMALQHTLR